MAAWGANAEADAEVKGEAKPRGDRWPLAFTGTAALCALGGSREAIVAALRAGCPPRPRRRVTEVGPPGKRVPWEAFPVFALPESLWEPAGSGLEGEIRRCLQEFRREDDPDLRGLARVVAGALREAGIEPHSPKAAETALLVIDEAPGTARLVRMLLAAVGELPDGLPPRERADRLYDRLQADVFHLQGFLYPFYLSRMFGLRGLRAYLNQACASGIYALEMAHRLIVMGEAPRAVIAAVECPDPSPKTRWFAERGLLARSGEVRPFGRERNGFVLGEAAVAVVVEPVSALQDRRIRGIYEAGATA